LGGWDFLALDSKGFSGGLITGWNQNVSLINPFYVHLGLCKEVLNKSLGMTLTLLNVYGHYEGKQTYWQNLFASKCPKVDNLIIGGGLKFYFE
jgi:hypothetical protein